jgi:pyridoxine/pyridoxamine 5'-phosphate oxidase
LGRIGMTKGELYNFIAAQKLGVLGYVSPQGAPRSALVGIAVTPELEIIFDTVSRSRKYSSLIANPAVSFAIGWNGELTVQYEGHVFQPAGADLAHYQQKYFAAWPDGPDRLSWAGIVYFVVEPEWIRYSDFDRTPPLIEEFTF